MHELWHSLLGKYAIQPPSTGTTTKMATTLQATSTSSHIPPQAAVTTIFTPPASCGSWIDAYSWREDFTTLSSCFPGEPSIPGAATVYYSPAICPSGYSVDCTAMENTNPRVSFLAGETGMVCCPRCVAPFLSPAISKKAPLSNLGTQLVLLRSRCDEWLCVWPAVITENGRVLGNSLEGVRSDQLRDPTPSYWSSVQ